MRHVENNPPFEAGYVSDVRLHCQEWHLGRARGTNQHLFAAFGPAYTELRQNVCRQNARLGPGSCDV